MSSNEAVAAGEAVVIRDATPGDLEAVLALLRRAALPEEGVEERFGSFLVATRDDRVVGSCGLERYGANGLLRSVVVSAEERKLGIGRRLIQAALLRAREQDLAGVHLLTTTARAYFERAGFRIANRESAPEGIRGSWEFSNGCPSTAVFMSRTP